MWIKLLYVILDYGYGRDQCTDEAFEKETLELHGCTAPFGPHKDKICDEEKNATKVNDLYKKWYSKSIQVTSGCNKPCSYVTLRTNMIFDREKYHNTIARVQIYFKENITVTKAYHIYRGLTLIAEIGGYVGLFLGISMNQIGKLLDMFNHYIQKY